MKRTSKPAKPRKRNARAAQRVIERLRASEAELCALFAAMTDAIFVLDADGRCCKSLEDSK